MSRHTLLIGLLIIVAVGLFVGYWLGFVEDGVGDTAARFTALLALLIFIGGGMFAADRIAMPTAIRYAAIWIGLGAVLLLAYAWRDDIERMLTAPLG